MKSGFTNLEFTPKPGAKERADAVASVIKNVKLKYKGIEKQIHEAKIPHCAVDVNSLIKTECKKSGLSEKTIRIIAEWSHTIPGSNASKMLLTKDEKDG